MAARLGGIFVVVALGLIAADTPTGVTPTAEWVGSVEAEALQAIAPPVVTTAEGFAILWKVWVGNADVPPVDFVSQFVTVSTTRGSRLNVKHRLDARGNLEVLGMATFDLRPGFRYVLAAVPRSGVTAVNGQPLTPVESHDLLPTAKPYAASAEVAGKLHLAGSVTMSHLLNLWAEGFGKFHPKLTIDVDCDGTEAGEPKLQPDAVTILAASRPVGDAELKAWGEKLGRKVLALPVCEDDIAVIVHASNPVARLSPEQLKKMYAAGDALTWGAVGLTGDWADKPVTIHGRDDRSGTRRYLRRLAVGETGAEREQKAHPCYTQLVEAVAADAGAIGYCRGVNVTAGVRPVPVGPVGPMNVTRPFLRRTCHLVVAVPADGPVPPAVKEFLTYVYRLDGQSQLFRDGFGPVGKDVIDQQLAAIGVEEIK